MERWKNGWPLDESCAPLYFIDFIDLTNFYDAAFIKKSLELRKRGLSYQEISNLTGVSKTTAYRVTSEQLKSEEKTQQLKSGAASYGYILINGKQVEHPQEQQVIHIVMQHWHSGESFKAVAQFLNDRGLTTKMAKPWTYFAVRSLVKRQLKMKKEK